MTPLRHGPLTWPALRVPSALRAASAEPEREAYGRPGLVQGVPAWRSSPTAACACRERSTCRSKPWPLTHYPACVRSQPSRSRPLEDRAAKRAGEAGRVRERQRPTRRARYTSTNTPPPAYPRAHHTPARTTPLTFTSSDSSSLSSSELSSSAAPPATAFSSAAASTSSSSAAASLAAFPLAALPAAAGAVVWCTRVATNGGCGEGAVQTWSHTCMTPMDAAMPLHHAR